MKVEIRTASKDDVFQILPLVEEYWAFEAIQGFHPELVRPVLERLLSEPALGAGWLLEVGGETAGYLLAAYVFSLEYLGMVAEIDEFYVRPAHRGMGGGAQLIEAAEAGFRRAGCTRVSLQLSRRNDRARNFYLSRQYDDRDVYELMDKRLK